MDLMFLGTRLKKVTSSIGDKLSNLDEEKQNKFIYSDIEPVSSEDGDIWFDLTEYIALTINHGLNGICEPSGVISVKRADSLDIKFTPNEGYEIDKVLANGVDITKYILIDGTGVGTYSFKDIEADTTIEVTYKKKVKSFPIQVDFSLTHGDLSPSINGNVILVTIPDKENIENPIFITGSDTYCLDVLLVSASCLMELAGFNSTDNREVFSVFGIKKYVNGKIVDITAQDSGGLLWINLYAINNGEELTISKWSYQPSNFAGERGYLHYMNTPNTITTISNNLPVYLDISFTD